MNKLDKDYCNLLQDILDNGVNKKDRTGTGTISVFGRQIRHKMSDGFPLLTTKKMAWKQIVTELLWFLRGDTNIKFLVDNDCHIWDGDAYQAYLKESQTKIVINDDSTETHISPASHYNFLSKEEFINKIKTDDEFAKTWGDLGPIYGKQWRNWSTYDFSIDNDFGNNEFGGGWNVNGIDQIADAIDKLKTDPDSRRLMVSAWNVGELDSMTLPPCHYGFQLYTRELSFEERWILSEKYGYREKGGEIPTETETFNGVNVREEFNSMMNDSVIGTSLPTRAISLMFNMRSNDVPLGLPFNIASYGLLLEIIGKMVNMIPDELIANLGDTHIYLNQIDGVKEQIGREMTLKERVDYGVDVLGYDGLLDYGHTQTDNDKILEFLESCGDVPKRTREPFPLPTLKHMKTDEFYKSLSEDISLLSHLNNTDFVLENYQSHPTIKMPLSN